MDGCRWKKVLGRVGLLIWRKRNKLRMMKRKKTAKNWVLIWNNTKVIIFDCIVGTTIGDAGILYKNFFIRYFTCVKKRSKRNFSAVFFPLSSIISLKPNNVEHLFHSIGVQDILFQSRYRYISRKEQINREDWRRKFVTLITGILGLKRELNCWITSCISNACFNVWRAFIVRTMAAWMTILRSSSMVRCKPSFSFCSTDFNGTFKLILIFLLNKPRCRCTEWETMIYLLKSSAIWML